MRRRFGDGRAISLFTLGTMRALGSIEQMETVLKAAVRAGINHLETAPAYGPAERFLGEAMKRSGTVPEGGWVITSKLLPGLSLEEGQHQLEAMLRRLGRPHLDNLAVHGINRPEHLDWALQGDGNALLDWALSRGLVRQVGFSSHGDTALIQTALQSGRFRFCSLHLHLLDPTRIPLARWALDHGLGVMAISPADKGGRLQDPSPTLIDDCHPVAPLTLAYRFLLAAGVSTLTIERKPRGIWSWQPASPRPTVRWTPARKPRWSACRAKDSAGSVPTTAASAVPVCPVPSRCRFRICCDFATWRSAMT